MRLQHAPPDARTTSVLRVAVVEDDRTTRQALGMLIDGTAGYRCVGQYASVEAALAEHTGVVTDVVLLDINLPGMSGSSGVRLFRERFPATEVLMLTVYADEARIFESICNGAVGYLLKKTPAPKLLAAIREAAGGGAPMSPEVARKVVTLFRQVPPPAAERVQILTSQELRLLQALADGYSYQTAADRLSISVNTVRTHVRSIYEKLHVHSKSGAVSQALRRGLIV